MKKTILSLLAVLFSFSVFAQANVEFKKANFTNDREGFEKAHSNLQKADGYFAQGPHRYERALKYYLLANDFNPNNAYLNSQIGTIYKSLNLPNEALPFFEKAAVLDPRYTVEGQRIIAITYHLDMQWDRAVQEYEKYLSMLDTEMQNAKKEADREAIQAEKEDIQLRIQQCRNGKEVIKDTVRIVISNLGKSINTKYPEYSAIATEDDQKIFFTSRRSTVTGGEIPPGDVYYYEDVFYSQRNEDGQWDGARSVPGSINTKDHEGLVAISKDGKKMIIYRYKNGGDLFESEFDGKNWTAARPITEINSPYRESHAAYAPDGNTLYFVSENIELGAKNRDIFYVVKGADGKWGKPVRLSDDINTPYNEDGVYIESSGKTMYFASQGHNSMGGYDIFRSEWDGEKWGKPVNLGYPANTPSDEVFFTVQANGRKAYFDSNRRGGRGEKDIYQMLFVDNLELTLKGIVYNSVTRQPVVNPEIILSIPDEPSQAVPVTGGSDGSYTSQVSTRYTYNARIKARGYDDYETRFQIEDINLDSLTAHKDFFLSPGGDIVWTGSVIDGETGTRVPATITMTELMTKAENIVNTTADKGFDISLEGGRAYTIHVEAQGYLPHEEMISANEAGAENGVLEKDISVFKKGQEGMFTMNGKVYDATKKQAIDAKITVYKENKNLQTSTGSDKNSGYSTQLANNTVYYVKVEAEGYNTLEERVKLNVAKNRNSLKKDFYLTATPGNLLAIKNIYFDFDRYNLRPDALTELANLKKMLNGYPDATVELSGHTDMKGTYEYNKVLSLNRARAAYDWLIGNGISKDRIKYTYYSFSKPAAANTNADGSDNAAGRALNRRVEFKVYNIGEEEEEE